MVVYEKNNQPYSKRNPTITDVTDKVQRFGLDNLYPQRATEVVKRSFTLKSVLSRLADFVNGEGFLNDAVGKLQLNNEGLLGQTANDVLAKMAELEVKYNRTVCLHIGYNLNYRMSSITPVEFDYCRLGLPCDDGKVDNILYSTNWERDGRKGTGERHIDTYHTFNPDPAVVMQQMFEAGGIEHYKGQILFLTPNENEYPLASFDPVFEQAQTQSELGSYKLSSTQKKFMADLAIVYPGEFASESEKNEFLDLIENKSGAKNAGSRIGIQDKTGLKKASDIFQPLNPPNTDKLFETTEKLVSDAIMENYGIPKEIIGVRAETGMFNQENMEQAYTYVNSTTRNNRIFLSRIMSKLLTYWWMPITDECVIKEQQYVVDNTAGTDNLNVRDNLAGMTGKQSQNMWRIIRKFLKGEINRDQAKVLLQGGFGLSEEEIDKMLSDPGADATTAPPVGGAVQQPVA